MLDRTRRARVAVESSAKETAGSTRPRSPGWLVAGNQCSLTAKNRMKRSPSQKTGMETPVSAPSIASVSIQLFCLSPEIIPSVIPKKTARIIAATARMKVFGRRSQISRATG